MPKVRVQQLIACGLWPIVVGLWQHSAAEQFNSKIPLLLQGQAVVAAGS